MGNIDSWMTKSYITTLLNKMNIFPNKITLKTSQNKRGCAFLEFESQEEAEDVLINFNGKKIENLELKFNRVKTLEEKYAMPQIVKFTVK